MRTLVIISCILALHSTRAFAQEQERKLLDRLLKPDMSLQNHAQEKKFVAAGPTLEKKARTKSFFVRDTRLEKQFHGTRAFNAKEFRTATSRHAGAQANLTTRNQIPNAATAYSTANFSGVRTATDAIKSVPSSGYPGERPFLVRGKSQKSLSAQDRPLTIDQVRELLNKNK